MITLNDVPVQKKEFLTRKVGDETIIISENGDEIHTLNEIGNFIWEKIDGKNSILSIIELICDEYKVERKIAKSDILVFFDKLKQKNLIEI